MCIPLSLIICLFLPARILTLTDLTTHEVVFTQIVKPGDTFKTVYIHSLELTPVWEYFQIRADGSMLLTDTVYSSSGAGLPIPDAGQQVTILPDGRFHLSGLNRRLLVIFLRVGTDAQNTLWLNDQIQVNLSEIVGNAVVKIEIRRQPYVLILPRAIFQTKNSGIQRYSLTSPERCFIVMYRIARLDCPHAQI